VSVARVIGGPAFLAVVLVLVFVPPTVTTGLQRVRLPGEHVRVNFVVPPSTLTVHR
jgi:hypothetical protein